MGIRVRRSTGLVFFIVIVVASIVGLLAARQLTKPIFLLGFSVVTGEPYSSLSIITLTRHRVVVSNGVSHAQASAVAFQLVFFTLCFCTGALVAWICSQVVKRVAPAPWSDFKHGVDESRAR